MRDHRRAGAGPVREEHIDATQRLAHLSAVRPVGPQILVVLAGDQRDRPPERRARPPTTRRTYERARDRRRRASDQATQQSAAPEPTADSRPPPTPRAPRHTAAQGRYQPGSPSHSKGPRRSHDHAARASPAASTTARHPARASRSLARPTPPQSIPVPCPRVRTTITRPTPRDHLPRLLRVVRRLVGTSQAATRTRPAADGPGHGLGVPGCFPVDLIQVRASTCAPTARKCTQPSGRIGHALGIQTRIEIKDSRLECRDSDREQHASMRQLSGGRQLLAGCVAVDLRLHPPRTTSRRRPTPAAPRGPPRP